MLLAIFHFVFAVFALLMTVLIAFQGCLIGVALSNVRAQNSSSNQMPAAAVPVVTGFFLFIALLALLAAIGNLLVGLFILKRKNRVFSLVVAGLNCLNPPFGTALGIFTLIVLSRDSVQRIYRGAGAP